MMKIQSARIYDTVLGANGAAEISVVGNFCKLLSATGRMRIKTDTGYQVDALPGQGLRDIEFNRLFVTDLSGAANTITLLAGGAVMVDDRITGDVNIIDGSRLTVLAGLAGSASGGTAGVAAQLTMRQVFNPAGSGKVVEVSNIFISSPGAGNVIASIDSAQRATLGGAIPSKLGGGAALTSQYREENAVALPGTLTARILTLDIAANNTLAVKLDERVILPAGFGLTVAHLTVNTALTTTMHVVERPA